MKMLNANINNKEENRDDADTATTIVLQAAERSIQSSSNEDQGETFCRL